MSKPLFLSILFCFSYFIVPAQTDNTFWFAVPEVSQTGGSNLDRPIFVRMTAFASAATVTISQPAGGGMPPTVISIAANSTASVDLTPWIDLLETKPANTVLNYGIRISSTAPITAYYDVVSGACLCNPEDFVFKGRNALGTDFWIPGQDTLTNWPTYTPAPKNSFDIIATENGTTVTITPYKDIVGHAAGVTYSITMNEGQVYSATAVGNLGPDHLAGSRVTSDKPIAITEKDDLLNFIATSGVSGQDLIGDQIVPVNVLGTEYIPMYGNLSSPPGDKLFITATQNLTTITVNGVYVITINAGDTYKMNAGNPNCYIQTNYPVYVYQLSGIGSEVGSALLPQINCTGSNSVSFQQSSTINFKLNILVKTAGMTGFLVNGVAGVITPGMFVPVPATGGVWHTAQVTLPVATYPIGTVLTVSNPGNLFQLGFLSSGPPGSGADFGYFSNYGGINPNPGTTTPDICVGDSIHLFADSLTLATYSWTGPGGFTSTLQDPFISGTSAIDSGVYKVVVNTPGCSDSGTVTIAVHPYPLVNLGPDTTVCGGPITLQSLDPAFSTDTYLWSTTETTSSISASFSGTYWVAISNAGCVNTDSIDVTVITVPLPTVTPLTYCQYQTAAPLTATGAGLKWYTTATGGTGSTTAPTPSTLIPGTISYYVTASSGPCESARVPLNVTVNVSPLPPVVTGVSLYCYGQPFVPITVTGTDVLWYTDATGGTGTSVTPVISTTTPGIDSFYATQTIAGCESPRQLAIVTVLEKIVPLFSFVPHYGCVRDTCVFTNSSTGASVFAWTFGDGYYDTAANPTHIYPQGIYTVTLLASNHYCADSIKMTDSLVHHLQAAFVDTPFIYCQDSLVLLTNITDSFSNGPLTYRWIFGDGSPDDSVPSTSHVYKNSGIYTVQLVATNFIPCHDTASLKLHIDSTTSIGLSVTDSVICRSTYITFAGHFTDIGNIGITWNFGDGDSIKNVNPVSHAYDAVGTFTVTATPHYRACRDTSISKSFTIFPGPSINIGDEASICPGSNSIEVGDTMNKAPKATWKWNTGETSPMIRVTEPGKYFVTVNINGCYSTDTITVKNDCYMNIPNVFTPNADGMNDYFFPREFLTKGLISFTMNIYNRWGQQIFETSSLTGAGWDGKFNGVAQPEGVYVYVIDAKFKDGQKEHHQGNVTLLR